MRRSSAPAERAHRLPIRPIRSPPSLAVSSRPLPAASERDPSARIKPSRRPARQRHHPKRGWVEPCAGADASGMGHVAERLARAALLLLTLAVAACAIQFTLHLAGSVQDLLERWIYEPTVIAAGLVCMARGFVGRTERAAWSLIGLGVVLWGVGDTIWTFVYVDDASPPYPCISDVFWLALYPPVYVGFLLLVRSRAGGLRRSLWLDGVMASLAVASVGTAFVFHVVLDATD